MSISRTTARAATTGLCLLLAAASFAADEPAPKIRITETKMCSSFTKDRKPVSVTTRFPAGTRSVHCWFRWKGASAGMRLTAQWHYVSENIHILDFPVTLNRTSDKGIVTLEMPEEKELPAGKYRLDLEADGTVLRSVSFSVSED